MRNLWRRLRGKLTGMESLRVPLSTDPMERAEQLREFSGCWIAVWDDAVVATEQSPDELFRKLDEFGLPDAAVTRIPDSREVFVGLG